MTSQIAIKVEPIEIDELSSEFIEPDQFYQTLYNGEQLQTCCLCSVGQELRDELIEHLRMNHSLESSKISIDCCMCPESTKIQLKIINHLLSHCKAPDQIKPERQIEEPEYDTEESPCRTRLKGKWQEYSEDSVDELPRKKRKRSEKVQGDFQVDHEYTIDNETLKFRCNYCLKLFTMKQAVKKHLNRFHSSENEPCQSNPEKSECQYKTYYESDTSLDRLSRKKRKRTEKPKGAFKVHREFTIDDDTQKYRCNYCQKLFTMKQGVQKHLNKFHDPSNPKKPGKWQKALDDPNLQKMPCPFCTQVFITKISVAKHIQKEHPDKEEHRLIEEDALSCYKCPKKFSTDKQLLHHLYTHREKRLECDYCSWKFNNKEQLKNHILRHVGLYEYKISKKKIMCAQCSMMVFSHKMKIHIMTRHNYTKPFHCDEPNCTSGFTDIRMLKDHKNIHLGIRPYLCEFCNERFPYRSQMRVHVLRHTQPEKWKCPTCHDCFASKTAISKHLERAHLDPSNDDRPFACEMEGCSSTFKFSDYLRRHLKTVHFKKPSETLYCSHCNYVAHNRKNYYQHLRRAHNVRKQNARVFPAGSGIQ